MPKPDRATTEITLTVDMENWAIFYKDCMRKGSDPVHIASGLIDRSIGDNVSGSDHLEHLLVKADEKIKGFEARLMPCDASKAYVQPKVIDNG